MRTYTQKEPAHNMLGATVPLYPSATITGVNCSSVVDVEGLRANCTLLSVFGNGKQLGVVKKNFTPRLPIVKKGFGMGEIFSREGIRSPLDAGGPPKKK